MSTVLKHSDSEHHKSDDKVGKYCIFYRPFIWCDIKGVRDLIGKVYPPNTLQEYQRKQHHKLYIHNSIHS